MEEAASEKDQNKCKITQKKNYLQILLTKNFKLIIKVSLKEVD